MRYNRPRRTRGSLTLAPLSMPPWGGVGTESLSRCRAQRLGPDDLGKQQGRRQKKAIPYQVALISLFSYSKGFGTRS